MNINYVAFILFGIFLCGCNSKNSEKGTDFFSEYKNAIKMEVDKYPELSLINYNEILIDFDTINTRTESLKYKPTQFTKIFEKEKVLIGTINKVLKFEESLYLVDKQTKSIYESSVDGKLLNTIRNVGRGKGEYLNLTDVAINKENRQLIIGDVKMKKLVWYDLEGRFVKESKFPIWYREFAVLTSGDFCFLTLSKNSTGYKIIFTDSSLKLKGKAIQANNSYRLNLFNSKTPLIKLYNKEAIIGIPFVDNIFKINEDFTISSIYQLNLGNRRFVYDDSKHFRPDLLNEEMNENLGKSLHFTGSYIANDKYSLFGLIFKNKTYNVAWDKKKRKLVLINPSIIKRNYLELPFPIYSMNGEFISIIDSEWLINEKEELASIYGIGEFLDGLSVNSNPVMINFTLEETDR